MNFAAAMEGNPPRLVVLFKRDTDGGEQYQWGIVGSIPLLGLIGHITRVQMQLVSIEWIPECNNDPAALAIIWNNTTRRFQHFVSSDIPTDSLVGMLETIKLALTSSRLGQQAAAQRVEPPILGPDGKPIRS